LNLRTCCREKGTTTCCQELVGCAQHDTHRPRQSGFGLGWQVFCPSPTALCEQPRLAVCQTGSWWQLSGRLVAPAHPNAGLGRVTISFFFPPALEIFFHSSIPSPSQSPIAHSPQSIDHPSQLGSHLRPSPISKQGQCCLPPPPPCGQAHDELCAELLELRPSLLRGRSDVPT
jgi:hypothetical protein